MFDEDEPTYEDAAWQQDMANLAMIVVLILSVVAATGFGFWLWGWL